MVLDHSNNTDIRGGIINSVGGDQIHTINNLQISFSLFGIGQTRHVSHNIVEDSSRSIGGISSERLLLIPSDSSSDVSSMLDTAVCLIIRITHLLLDNRGASDNHRDLTLELKSLHQSLTLAGLAITEYEGRPLGQSLAKTVSSEAERCCMVLQELLDRVDGTWQGLNPTSINSLWRPVWWCRWDGDELASLRKDLTKNRRSVEGFLLALHSYVVLVNHVLPEGSSHFQNKITGYHGWRLETNSKPDMYPSQNFMLF